MFEHFGKLVYEGDHSIGATGSSIGRGGAAQQQMKQLQNSVNRLNSLIGARQRPGVGKEVANEASQKKEKTKE